jgi:hypothetical protein
MMRKSLILAGLILVSISCQQSKSLRVQLTGKWRIQKILIYDEDVSAVQNPDKERWISFDREGRFASGGEPYGENSGTFSLGGDDHMLLLGSDAGAGDDSYWHIEISEDTLVMHGVGTERQNNSVVRLIRY